MNENKNLDIYIQSLEASNIWEHINRDKEIQNNFVGMIPYSLESMQLRKVMKKHSMKPTPVKESNKETTDAVINVKFNSKVKSGEEIIKKMQKNIPKIEAEKVDAYKEKMNQLQVEISENSGSWNGVSNNELRRQLYKDGFTITDENGNETHYKAYKRSSSKSRSGQCLFIHEDIYNDMVNWSRMGLKFPEDKKIDFASLLAYESLVGSSIKSTIKINPKNILLVDDVESEFTRDANVVKKNEKTGLLDSFPEKDVKISNSIFDGESLLDHTYFKGEQADKSMLLLRNHMFKSAAFNTNIQLFLKEYADKNGIDYDTWKIKNMFGQYIKATDIHLITTPSSLKALRFSKDIFGDKENPQKEMWNYWKKVVNKDEKKFGVCKTEGMSKRGKDENKNVLQQMSYQMINSIPFKREQVKELSEFERGYIERLKNEDKEFISYLADNANKMNSNDALVDLYHRNNKIVNTILFKNFRKKTINKYVTYVKNGKIRLPGDYAVLLGNGLEFLYHSISQYDVNKSELALKGNQVYTTMFKFGDEYTAFRNPHTSPSNVLVVENTYNKDIERYFNLTDNIVCVNSVKFEILDILSGADFDSDTIAIFNNEKLLQASKGVENYNVCINHLDSQKASYEPTMSNMSIIDNTLSQSQRHIGKIVNLGQQCMSMYWDGLEDENKSDKKLSVLLKKTDVMTVLSGVAIDMAKKLYNIDMKREIKNVDSADVYKTKKVDKTKKDKETGELLPVVNKETGEIATKQIKANPLFFLYVKQSKTIKDRIKFYDTSMDHLYEVLKKQEYAKHRSNIDFMDILVDKDTVEEIKKGDPDYGQHEKIIDYVTKMSEKLKNAYGDLNKIKDDEEMEKEHLNKIDDIIRYYEYYVGKLEVKPATMHHLLNSIVKDKDIPAIKLIKVLHKTQYNVFINSFKLA
ncbi:hypothetical protein [Virgibacillus sp. CBA3643]|uniref:hypothetical protein n=1 Tax=Virgibacillus sp. CBA3643 TaxID=2942278 RepID=UPI0035A2AB02